MFYLSHVVLYIKKVFLCLSLSVSLQEEESFPFFFFVPFSLSNYLLAVCLSQSLAQVVNGLYFTYTAQLHIGLLFALSSLHSSFSYLIFFFSCRLSFNSFIWRCWSYHTQKKIKTVSLVLFSLVHLFLFVPFALCFFVMIAVDIFSLVIVSV